MARDDSSRDSALKEFATIDQSLSLDAMTDEQIDDMPQWSELTEAINDLDHLLFEDEINWEDVGKKEKDIEQMLRNARYRLNPEGFGMRSKALLSPGSKARARYEERLTEQETRMNGLQRWLLHDASPGTEMPMGIADVKSSDVEAALQAYIALEDSAPVRPPELSAVELNRHSLTAAGEYKRFVKDNDLYAGYLEKLHASEMVLNSIAMRAWRSAPAAGGPSGTEATLPARIQSAISRREQLGLLYLDEVEDRASSVRDSEIAKLAPILGQDPNVAPLSTDEKTALHQRELKSYGNQITTITNRLQDVQGLQIPDKPEDVVGGIGMVIGDYDETDFFVFGFTVGFSRGRTRP